MSSKLKKMKGLELSEVLKIIQALNIYKPIFYFRLDSLNNVENKQFELVFLNVPSVSWGRTYKWVREENC